MQHFHLIFKLAEFNSFKHFRILYVLERKQLNQSTVLFSWCKTLINLAGHLALIYFGIFLRFLLWMRQKKTKKKKTIEILEKPANLTASHMHRIIIQDRTFWTFWTFNKLLKKRNRCRLLSLLAHHSNFLWTITLVIIPLFVTENF